MASGFADARSRRAPPPLLPAPEAPCFSTAPEMGPLRHIIAQLSPLAASRRQLSAMEKEERAAAKREEKEEKAAVRREEQRCRLAELVRPPPLTYGCFLVSVQSEAQVVVSSGWLAHTLAVWRLGCAWWQLRDYIGL